MEKNSKFRPKLPPWIRVRVSCGKERNEVDSILKGLRLNTVCESAECPNLNECWHRKTATFMILGSQCTRNCKFCAVSHSPAPPPPEADEPARVAEAVKKMKLSYVVVTSVTRDDLPDGGASHFAAVIRELYKAVNNVKVEVLTPDFNGSIDALKTVLDEKPSVFNHNVETVERLSSQIRSRANYRRSLELLSNAVRIGGGIPVKSGLMAGLGETDEEILNSIRDIRNTGASILTIGQYLPPSAEHWQLQRYVEPEKFKEWGEYAYSLGFSFVASSPLVRSSYNAEELLEKKLF
ncbi:MAG: lipoyl synthase [Lentisphaerae bacterium GWF2_44_16]|nr:MAG: lipoyl synthase [Lentisphaerae bacterium GWF2_44_16]